LRAGLTLYDALALFRNVAPHESLSREAIAEGEPALRRDGLIGGARYFDAAADDARLTLANVIDTAERGGVVINHAAVVELLAEGGRATGAVVRDGLGDTSVRVRARVVVNATGPWSDRVRALEGNAPRTTVLGSKGAHIAVPRERLANRDAVVLLAPEDGRVMFALPAGDTAVIGTTETSSTESPDDIRASSDDVRYLLAAANAHFPSASLRGEDVLASWAGLRPLVATLVHGAQGSASREHSIDVDGRRVVHVTGGKLTTYRSMAQEIVDVALRQADGPRPRGGATSMNPLPGGDASSFDGLVAEAAATITDARIARRIVSAHGTRWRDVWSFVASDPALAEPLGSGGWTPAEVLYAMEREFACSLGDALIRRLHLAFELPDHGREAAARVVRVLARRRSICGASSERAALDAYDAEARRIFG
jgi:glycerol-3-phosphate dehydrogenase